MKRSANRIGFGIALWLGIPLGLGAKTYTFHFPPEGHKDACDKYESLKKKGLNVKADRHMRQYYAKHLSVFSHPDHRGNVQVRRTYRLAVPGGWKPKKAYGGGTYFEGKIQTGVGEFGVPEYDTFSIEGQTSQVEIPDHKLEEWEDILYKHFSREESEGEDEQKHSKYDQWVFSEITVRESKPGVSYISFCGQGSGFTGIRLESGVGNLILVSYKLQRLSNKATSDEKTGSTAPNAGMEIDTAKTADEAADEKAETKHAEATIIRPLLFFDDEGDPAPFNRLLQNGPIVLNFTASYCAACEEELKLLKELHAKRKKPEAQLVVVDIDKKKNQELYANKFRALMGKKPPAQMQLLFDPYQKNYQKVNGDTEEKLPLTLLVDRDGKILRKITGFDRAGLEQLYKKLETLR